LRLGLPLRLFRLALRLGLALSLLRLTKEIGLPSCFLGLSLCRRLALRFGHLPLLLALGLHAFGFQPLRLGHPLRLDALQFRQAPGFLLLRLGKLAQFLLSLRVQSLCLGTLGRDAPGFGALGFDTIALLLGQLRSALGQLAARELDRFVHPALVLTRRRRGRGVRA